MAGLACSDGAGSLRAGSASAGLACSVCGEAMGVPPPEAAGGAIVAELDEISSGAAKAPPDNISANAATEAD